MLHARLAGVPAMARHEHNRADHDAAGAVGLWEAEWLRQRVPHRPDFPSMALIGMFLLIQQVANVGASPSFPGGLTQRGVDPLLPARSGVLEEVEDIAV